MIKIDKLIPDWDMEKFISLNGYTINNFSASFSPDDLIPAGRSKVRVSPSSLKDLYFLIKLQEKSYVDYYTKSSSEFRNYFYSNIKFSPAGSTNFTDYMENLYNRYKKPYLSNLLPYTRNGRCSYCQISRANTLDHFLPKSRYPLLAISPWNLVPCCSECNSSISIKNAEIKSPRLIHPFFLNTDLTKNLCFNLSNDVYVLNTIESLEIKTHAETASIIKKWNSLSLSEMSELKELYASFKSLDQGDPDFSPIEQYVFSQSKSLKVAESTLYRSIEDDLDNFKSLILDSTSTTKVSVPSNCESEISKYRMELSNFQELEKSYTTLSK
ncbi:HNH endonuclease [Rothia nasimurium]|uniref:HNH endonuclease n=1 Tax=Rothia nasimurium TaxID=85336 RepID=UPI001F285BAE|nr:HNH endonuclease signature motif containing protein [Rothia nasimurium]